MNTKQKLQIAWYRVKEYLPRIKKSAASEKGSPTMEYVVIIAVGALFAAILYNIFKDDEGGAIKGALTEKVKEMIGNGKGAGGQGGGKTPPPSNVKPE
jgi:hypothetical protein